VFSVTQTIAQTVPTVLRGELGARELSRAALAKKLGKTPDWVTRRLRGTTEITLADLDELCHGLGLEPVIEFRPAPKKSTPKKASAGRGHGRRPSDPNTPLAKGKGR
jgi:transcriptional regulator with XRE-family HTH domain